LTLGATVLTSVCNFASLTMSLEQRTSGRRARRRIEMEKTASDQHAFRRPAPHIEAKIAEAIAARNDFDGGHVHDDDGTLESESGNRKSNTSSHFSSSSTQGYEYLDHTADIQLHSWGEDLPSALEQLALSMFGYMTTLTNIEGVSEEQVEAEGHDESSLIYNYLSEWLYQFHETGFIPKKVKVRIEIGDKAQTNNHINDETVRIKIRSTGVGEPLDLRKHCQGTEIKAITYSNLHVRRNAQSCHIWVIVDI